MTASPLVLGIDLGTSAVRAVVSDLHGNILSDGKSDFPAVEVQGPRREQNPEDWWKGTCKAIHEALDSLDTRDKADIKALAVDATSGTIVLCDSAGKCLTRGIMYNDARAKGYGERINRLAPDFIQRHGYRFKDSFSLSKLWWLSENGYSLSKDCRLLHQADYINYCLCGEFTATDWSNALKSGCDLHESKWPEFLDRIGIPLDALPKAVTAPGSPLGKVSPTIAEQFGLPKNCEIVAGSTDGTAALFASGAVNAGDYSTVLGSTLTVKGVSDHLIQDDSGALYCHRHPARGWLPGGACNAGCTALNSVFFRSSVDGKAIRELDQKAEECLPTPLLLYPLAGMTQEIFPVKKDNITGWMEGNCRSAEDLYAAYLQGIAFVERWCYDRIEELGGKVLRVFSTGGGAKSRVWNRLRCDLLQRPVLIPEQTETVMGTALLAASHITGDLSESSKNMIRVKEELAPKESRYEDLYQKFRETCDRRWSLR